MYILFVKLSFLHARAKMKIYQTGIPVFWEIKTQIKLVTPNPVASEESNYANPGFALSSLLSLCTLTSSYPTIPTSGIEETNVGRGRGFCHCFRFSFVINAAAQGIRFPKMFPSKTSFYRRLPFLNNCSFHPFSHPKENCKMQRTIYGGDYQIRLIRSHWFARQFLLCNKLHQWNSLKMYLYSIDPRPGILIQDQIFQSNRAENWPI